ncbi:glutathione S-transferase family protein [Brevundimonas sp.]|uniref:glutathione S-transferase family protein n=1 Tax=Brevundimonas sp. TaxID=1871086 RepID=UPI002CB9C4B1|nr:glutathione S-transferase family protein [Brevundimonas sp.]HWQ86942.1 glutathione S-transferase family protein [Brevundimonas sp.]
MALHLWSHPYAGYGQKAAVALYELGLPFELKLVRQDDPAVMAGFRAVSPFAKMPALVDTEADRTLFESSIVIEHLDRLAGGGRLIPADPDAALEARFIDRILDTYVGGPMNRIVLNKFRPEGQADDYGAAQDAGVIATAWGLLEMRLGDGRTWGAGETFTLADCAAAPILTYARRLVPFGDRPRLKAWHSRLMARPSFVRALEDAAPFGDLMPAPPPQDD